MRKIGRYALVFLLLIIAMLPWVEGVLFKKKYLHLIDLINQDNRIKVDVLEYHEGWLHSQAKIYITINKGLSNFYQITPSKTQSSQPIGLTIEENINHGPIIYDPINNKISLGYAQIKNNIHLSSQLESALLGSLSSEGILQAEMLSKFDGAWSGKIHIPTLSLSIHDLGKLTWLGLNGNFNIIEADNNIKRSKFKGKIESIIIQSAIKNPYLTKIVVQPVEYKYDVLHEKTGLFTGNSNMYTPGFSIMRSDDSNVIVNKFAMHSAFSMDGNTFYNTNMNINVKNTSMPNNIISVISQLHIMLEASNLSTHGLFDYLNYFKFNSSKAMIIPDFKTFEGLLVHTVIPTSIFHGNISLNTPLGGLTCYFISSWLSNVPGPNTFSDIIANADTKAEFIISPAVVAKLMELYNGEINIFNTPNGKAVLIKHQLIARKYAKESTLLTKNTQATTNQTHDKETSQQLIDDLVLGGFLGKDYNNNYVFTVTIESGVWKINGKAVNSQ